MSTRRDAAFLDDVLDAARKISAIVAGTSEQSFVADEIRQAAVLHHLTVIGEAVTRLSKDIKDRHPEVPWKPIASVRHRIVHAYFDLDWRILWVAATEDVPALAARIAAIRESDLSYE